MSDLNYQIYDTDTLLGVLYDKEAMEPAGAYWRSMFPNSQMFDTEWIDFDVVSGMRKVAPLVTPMAEGRPIMNRAETLKRVKPAYIKVTDPVNHTRVIRKHAGLGEVAPSTRPLSPRERYNAIVVDILREHRKAVEWRWETMAFEAVSDGKLVLEDDGYPRTEVDFGRDPANTIVKAAGSRWGDAGVDILRDIEDMVNIVRKAKGGGNVNRITLGANAFDRLRSDDKIREMMNLNYRNNRSNGVDIYTGVASAEDVKYVGTIAEGIDLYVYRGYIHDPDGNPVDLMNPNDIIMTAPSFGGIMCYGAILDKRANWRGLPIFPKMYDDEKTGTTIVQTASAPLPVPVNPNATLKATVTA